MENVNFECNNSYDDIQDDIDNKAIEIPTSGCYYIKYHSQCGGPIKECKAHLLKPKFTIENVKLNFVLGLNTTPNAKTRPVKHLANAVMNKILYFTAREQLKKVDNVKSPLKLKPMDHNTTYTEGLEASKVYVKSLAELFTTNHSSIIKVTPLSSSDLQLNRFAIGKAIRAESYKSNDDSKTARVLYDQPAYIVLIHQLEHRETMSAFKSLFDLSDQDLQTLIDIIYQTLTGSQYLHYMKRIKMNNFSNDKDKFNKAMCEYSHIFD